ncbi:crotonobetainyl-CoA--carnitine CoA-transferase [Saccharothrix obliqua]|uniref:crotonobetainyl-CoA--carnitine CoA-transferase n=1 Tax=Saccharothrix obliqua TaxID=2861747 RepID=UPI001C5D34F6|nr:crotonobetainyl-CoA--carnitine CoA-transferase [Saccharothrix obliqua]MBW4722023.1 crotonobetainyl-CoA--carnitine CoA-transferase [Saccharothrix obliqua]
MGRARGTAADFVAVARSYVDAHPDLSSGSVDEVPGLELDLDERFCLEVADVYDRAPRLYWDDEIAGRYALFKQANLVQYQAIRAAGLDVRPWADRRNPYRDSRDLARRVRESGVLHVFLTAVGHGPGEPVGFHPLREPSGVVEHGVALTHNDVFRVVHDVFGHVMHGHSFGPSGEFRATRTHLPMYPVEVHPVLLTEQVGQVCWFFFGPHLRTAGRVPNRGEPGHTPPDRRPYPEQKVFPLSPDHVARFTSLFKEGHG